MYGMGPPPSALPYVPRKDLQGRIDRARPFHCILHCLTPHKKLFVCLPHGIKETSPRSPKHSFPAAASESIRLLEQLHGKSPQ